MIPKLQIQKYDNRSCILPAYCDFIGKVKKNSFRKIESFTGVKKL